jgi:hypothetical protein
MMKLSERLEHWEDMSPMQFVAARKEAAQLEAELAKEIESRDGWRDAWKKSESENEALREGITTMRNAALAKGGYNDSISGTPRLERMERFTLDQ